MRKRERKSSTGRLAAMLASQTGKIKGEENEENEDNT